MYTGSAKSTTGCEYSELAFKIWTASSAKSTNGTTGSELVLLAFGILTIGSHLLCFIKFHY